MRPTDNGKMTADQVPKTNRYVFGPVSSRRLGLSLGVDLIPAKTCTYDCLYCQLGKSGEKRVEPCSEVPVEEVLRELGKRLDELKPDTVTISGSGEPTLHPRIGEVISFVKQTTGTRVAVLTNGSLLWREDVRKGISGADLILPTFSTAVEKTFRAIHRPHRDLRLQEIMEGLRRLRREFRGELFVEVMLLRGFNDGEREIRALREVLDRISPDRIQLNTVVRPPSDPRALPLDRLKMEELKILLGSTAEVIAEPEAERREQQVDSLPDALLEMAGRRPLRVVDIAQGLSRTEEEVRSLVKAFVREGLLLEREHQGEWFYSRSTPQG